MGLKRWGECWVGECEIPFQGVRSSWCGDEQATASLCCPAGAAAVAETE